MGETLRALKDLETWIKQTELALEVGPPARNEDATDEEFQRELLAYRRTRQAQVEELQAKRAELQELKRQHDCHVAYCRTICSEIRYQLISAGRVPGDFDESKASWSEFDSEELLAIAEMEWSTKYIETLPTFDEHEAFQEALHSLTAAQRAEARQAYGGDLRAYMRSVVELASGVAIAKQQEAEAKAKAEAEAKAKAEAEARAELFDSLESRPESSGNESSRDRRLSLRRSLRR